MDAGARLNFRRAIPEDREEVERLCAKIWDGIDYVPRCFDAWVSDEAGEFILCHLDGRLAAFSKLSWLAPGEAWLEGLRKDPDLPVKGLGSALCRRHLARLARTPGLRSVRFSTYFTNFASIKLNEALGFTRIATASLKEMRPEALELRKASSPARSDGRLVVLRDPAAALAYVRASEWFGPFIHQMWRSHPWSEDFFLRTCLEPGHCVGLVEGDRIRAMAACLVDPVRRDGALPFFDADGLEAATILMAHLEARFAQEDVPAAYAIVPPGGTRAAGFLDALGWSSWEQEEDYLLYEFPLERLEEHAASPASGPEREIRPALPADPATGALP